MGWRTALIGLALAAASACRGPDCLRGGDCEKTAPCAGLAFTCAAPAVWIGRAGDAPGGVRLAGAEATADDLLLRNDRITLVLDDLDQPRDLAPTGGNLIDLGPTDGADDVNLIYQLAGILPDDAFAYRSVEVVDRSPDFVAAVLRGSLDGRPDVEVATRYELHGCEPGVRVRSELRNRSADTQVFIVADAAHWGKRRILPFTPRAGEGWLQPDLDLIELEKSWETFPYVAARAAAADAPSYGLVRCDADRLEGVNDPEVSALGTARTLVRPGEALVLERFVTTAAGGDLGAGVADLVDARRQLHGGPSPVAVTGRVVVAGGRPFGGDLRRASVVIGERSGDALIPLASVVPGDDGRFAGEVTADAVAVEVWSFGRRVAVADGPAGSQVDLGDLLVPEPGRVTLTVADEAGPRHAVVAFDPADDDTRRAVTGSFHGRFGDCAPWLGPPHGASPACNRVLVPPGGVEVEVPAGHYWAYATGGPDHTLARRELTVDEGEVYALDFTVEPIDLRPPGWLWADLHVHGRASFDSGIPDLDRVRSFAAAGVDVIAATDHDYVTAYQDALIAAGVDDRMVVLGGVETTQLIPFMEVPGDDFPRVIGHFNFWPVVPDPLAPRGGAPWDELVEPGELFDRMAPLVGDDGLMMMNHPWDDSQFGRDLGYLRAIEFDPRRPIPAADDGTRQGMLVRRPGGGRRNVDFDLIEVMNGAGPVNPMRTRPLWFSLLSQGYVKAGAANSDSHGLSDAQIGYARTLVDAGTAVAGFDTAAFDRALREGRAAGGNGVVVLATIGRTQRTGPSLAPYVPVGDDWIDVEVRAPPWIPVTELRITTSAGTVVVAQGDQLVHPDDPYGVDGVVRIRWTGLLDDILPGGGDDWIVVEAGMPFPIAADLDDDGVLDTSDNDGDGDVDPDDVDEGEDSGPLDPPADPIDPADPRFAATRVVPGLWPMGFSNPFLIDRAGDGWDPPGVAR